MYELRKSSDYEPQWRRNRQSVIIYEDGSATLNFYNLVHNLDSVISYSDLITVLDLSHFHLLPFILNSKVKFLNMPNKMIYVNLLQSMNFPFRKIQVKNRATLTQLSGKKDDLQSKRCHVMERDVVDN